MGQTEHHRRDEHRDERRQPRADTFQVETFRQILEQVPSIRYLLQDATVKYDGKEQDQDQGGKALLWIGCCKRGRNFGPAQRQFGAENAEHEQRAQRHPEAQIEPPPFAQVEPIVGEWSPVEEATPDHPREEHHDQEREDSRQQGRAVHLWKPPGRNSVTQVDRYIAKDKPERTVHKEAPASTQAGLVMIPEKMFDGAHEDILLWVQLVNFLTKSTRTRGDDLRCIFPADVPISHLILR